MSRVWRAFLVWVMVLTLPVQGMAASAMGLCGSMHASIHGPIHAPARGVAMWAMASHGPAAAVEPAAASDGGAAIEQGGHAHESQDRLASHHEGPALGCAAGEAASPHGQHGCSACAACCSALALPASFAFTEAVTAALALPPSPLLPKASHEPDRLDRPPRTSTA